MADGKGILAALSPAAKGDATPTDATDSGAEDSSNMSWRLAKKALIKASAAGPSTNGEGGTAGGSLEGADPELCITLLERGLNFTGLKARLRAADQAWIEHFITAGGIPALFDALEALGKKGFSSIADAIKQLDCVACVRAVMNNRFGLEFIVEARGESFVKRLTDGEGEGEGEKERERCVCLCVCVCERERGRMKVEVWKNSKELCVRPTHS